MIQRVNIFKMMVKWGNMNESDRGGQEVTREKVLCKMMLEQKLEGRKWSPV